MSNPTNIDFEVSHGFLIGNCAQCGESYHKQELADRPHVCPEAPASS